MTKGKIMTDKKKPYKIMIVEDQTMPRHLFEILVGHTGDYELLYSLESASVAHIYCDRYPIDLVLMDVVMKDRSSGLEAAGRIKKNHPEIKVVIMTSMPEVSFIERAKAAGVDSFWYKEGDGEGILDIMERTMKGERVYPAATPTVILGNIASTELTPTELDVLRELTRGASNAEIGEKLFISPITVRSHVSNMLAKTGFANRTELAIRARLEGLVIPED